MFRGPGLRSRTAFSSAAPVPDSTLLIDLVSAWPLSADGTDAYGSNDWTNNNGVTFVAKGGGAPANMPATVANFVAASDQSFSLASFVNATAWTFSAWGKATNAAPFDTLFSKQVSGFGNGSAVELYWNNGNLNAIAGDGSSNVQVVNQPITNATAWHLFTITLDTDKRLRLYVDGSLAATTGALAGTPLTAAATLFLGDAAAAIDNFDGQMSGALVYSRAIDATEASCLWNSGAGGFYPFTGLCLP